MRLSSLLPAVILTTMAIFLTGCSRNPVAPVTGTQAGVGSAAAVVPDDPPPVSGGGIPESETVSLSVTDESVITVGRWTLWLRKNSLTMPCTIKMSADDPEAMTVHFVVTPAAANVFNQPPVLTANLSDVAGVDYTTEAMFYWTSGNWLQSGTAAAHPNQQNISDKVMQLVDTMVGPASGGGKGKIGA